MGEFDKNPAPASAATSEKKKLMIVGLLTAVLAGVVGYHFLKGGPQTAEASGGGQDPAIAPVVVVAEQTPLQALEALDPSHDPTSKLLRGSAALPAEMLDVPHDPFKLSEFLRAQVFRPKLAEPKPVEPRHDDVKPQVVEAGPKPQAVNADEFKLAAIMRQNQQLVAVINGNFVKKGETVGTAKVINITDDRVTLRHIDWPDGPVTVLTIQAKLK
jgi:hypothetical protein